MDILLSQQFLQLLAAGILGGAVGSAELVSRYRDAPAGALRTRPAILYITINVIASIGALALAITFGWRFGLPETTSALAVGWMQTLVCGISSMALFRSSLFTVRAGDRDIGVGPSSFLQIFLSAADREVDRQRAVDRSSMVGSIMQGLDYKKSFAALPPYCLALMQNLPDDVQKDMRTALELLDKEVMDDSLKVRLLGLELVNVVGEPVLREAVKALKDDIRTGT